MVTFLSLTKGAVGSSPTKPYFFLHSYFFLLGILPRLVNFLDSMDSMQLISPACADFWMGFAGILNRERAQADT